MDQESAVTTWIMGLTIVGLAGVVVTEAWRRGVFDWRYLSTGPRRRLEVGPVGWWLGVIFVLSPPLVTPIAQMDPGQDPLGRLAQLTGVLLSTPFPALFLFVMFAARRLGGMREVGLIPRRLGREILWGLQLVVPATIVVFAVAAITNQIGAMIGRPAPMLGHEALRVMHKQPTAAVISRVIVMAVVVAPLLEEPCFRGLLQTVLVQKLGRRRRRLVVLSAASLFALVHVPVVSWHALPGLFVLGLSFGAMYERTGSLWPGMVAHAAFNATNVAIVLAMPIPKGPAGG